MRWLRVLTVLFVIVLAAGCGSLGARYIETHYLPGTTEVDYTVQGHLYRRGLLLQSQIPAFKIGYPSNAVISTEGKIETKGDTDLIRSVIDQGIKSGVGAAKSAL